MAQSAGLERWRNSAGELVGMKRLSAKQPCAGQVLLTYGNGSSAVGCAHYADDIQKSSALDVYILEYPGYEDRPGKPTQWNLFHAVDEAIQLLDTNKPIYLVGESLGTGVASYLAGTYTNRAAGVVLIAPFTSLTGAAKFHFPWLPVSLLLVDRFPSEVYLRNYHGRLEFWSVAWMGLFLKSLAFNSMTILKGQNGCWNFRKMVTANYSGGCRMSGSSLWNFGKPVALVFPKVE